jgi:hypothetical protein
MFEEYFERVFGVSCSQTKTMSRRVLGESISIPLIMTDTNETLSNLKNGTGNQNTLYHLTCVPLFANYSLLDCALSKSHPIHHPFRTCPA